MKKTEILDKFDNNMERSSIEIAQTWELRENSEFGKKLIQLSNFYDEYFRLRNKQNIFSLINDAYFFDGDKNECIEKIRKEIYKNDKDLNGEVLRLFLDLESMSDLNIEDTGISDFVKDSKSEIVSEKSTTLDFGIVDDIEFILINEAKDYNIKGSKVVCKYDTINQMFYIDFVSNKLTDEEAGYIDWKLYNCYCESSNMSKKDTCTDMKLVLYDKTENKERKIISLKSALVNSFANNGNVLTLTISAEWYVIEKDDDDQVANYVRHELSNTFNTNDSFESFAERMRPINFEDDF